MELNPNHPVSRTLHDHWHTIALMIMRKMGFREVVITPADIAAIEPDSLAITVQELEDGVHIKILPMEEGRKLARQEGGLPI